MAARYPDDEQNDDFPGDEMPGDDDDDGPSFIHFDDFEDALDDIDDVDLEPVFQDALDDIDDVDLEPVFAAQGAQANAAPQHYQPNIVVPLNDDIAANIGHAPPVLGANIGNAPHVPLNDNIAANIGHAPPVLGANIGNAPPVLGANIGNAPPALGANIGHAPAAGANIGPAPPVAGPVIPHNFVPQMPSFLIGPPQRNLLFPGQQPETPVSRIVHYYNRHVEKTRRVRYRDHKARKEDIMKDRDADRNPLMYNSELFFYKDQIREILIGMKEVTGGRSKWNSLGIGLREMGKVLAHLRHLERIWRHCREDPSRTTFGRALVKAIRHIEAAFDDVPWRSVESLRDWYLDLEFAYVGTLYTSLCHEFQEAMFPDLDDSPKLRLS